MQTFFLNFQNFVFLENHKTKNCDFLRKKTCVLNKKFSFFEIPLKYLYFGKFSTTFFERKPMFSKNIINISVIKITKKCQISRFFGQKLLQNSTTFLGYWRRNKPPFWFPPKIRLIWTKKHDFLVNKKKEIVHEIL